MNPATSALTLLLVVLVAGPACAAPGAPGRLFYTPAQRAELEAARARGARAAATPSQTDAETPRHYDGVLIRSDGQATHWIDGKPATTGPRDLRPGQTRAGNRVYEPYQLLSPQSTQSAPVEGARP